MAGVSVKLSADVGSFKKGIQEATSTVSKLDAQLKANESQLKATGDAEVYMSNQVGLLKQQLDAQKQVVASTNSALQAMRANGVSPTSTEFQKMEKNLANATGKMFEIQARIKEVESGSAGAKKEAGGMNDELKKIGKGVGFSNVTQGLKDITDRLESAGRAAVNMGKKIAKSAMDSTGWADDIMTRAVQNSVDAETIQRMDNVAQFIDTDVDTILAARGRLAKNSGKVEELFGLKTDGMSLEDQFWAVGEAIRGMTDDIEQEQAAQAVFGRGWKDLVPLFAAGREEYSRLMEEQNVLTNEQVQNLSEADDEFQKMQIELQRLKNEFWAENSGTIKDLLQWLIDNKGAVLTALTVIGGGFAALKVGELAMNIKKVVDGFNLIKGMGGGEGTPTGGTGGAPGGPGLNVKGKIAAALKNVGGFAVSGPGLALGGAVLATAAASNAVRDSADAKDSRTMEKIATAAEKLSNASEAARIGTDLRGAVGYATDENGRYITGFAGGRLLADPAAVEAALGTERGQGLWNAHDLSILKAILPTETYTRLGQYYAFMDATQRRGMGIDEASAKYGGVTAADATSIAEEVFGAIADSLDDAAAKQEAAAQAMTELPGAVAAAVESANITVVVEMEGSHANGLPFVPYDGLRLLHRGERVLTARENMRYTTNNYFGNVNLNNGLEIEALTESIDRRNRRQMAGFGAM